MPSTTRVSRTIRVPPGRVYALLMDGARLPDWLPPEGMRGSVHAFEPRLGGRIHMSLTYLDRAQGQVGKTSEDTDTFRAVITRLVPGRLAEWAVDFDSDDPAMRGRMIVRWEIEEPAPGGATGARVTCTCEGIPDGIRPEENEAGTASTLDNLARLLAASGPPQGP